MNEQGKQRLNERLAKWAGFTSLDPDKEWGCWILRGEPDPKSLIQPIVARGKLNASLNFTNSLDACFKWLVPPSHMNTLWIINNLSSPTHSIGYCFGFIRGKENDLICWSKDLPVEECLSPIAETPAAAICLAIEKLIGRSWRYDKPRV